LIAPHIGEEVTSTGAVSSVGFDSPDAAVATAIAIQRRLAEHRAKNGFAPQIRIGLHASDATQAGGSFSGKGVHEAARIAQLASGGEILASVATVADSAVPTSGPRSVMAPGRGVPMA